MVVIYAPLLAAFNNHSNLRPSTETTAPEVSGAAPGVVPPFAFNGDSSGNYSLDLSYSNAASDPAYTVVPIVLWTRRSRRIA